MPGSLASATLLLCVIAFREISSKTSQWSHQPHKHRWALHMAQLAALAPRTGGMRGAVVAGGAGKFPGIRGLTCVCTCGSC